MRPLPLGTFCVKVGEYKVSPSPTSSFFPSLSAPQEQHHTSISYISRSNFLHFTRKRSLSTLHKNIIVVATENTFKMPAAITPPPSIKELAVPKTSMMATQNIDMLNTKRKIICFSGTRADLVDPFLTLLRPRGGDVLSPVCKYPEMKFVPLRFWN